MSSKVNYPVKEIKEGVWRVEEFSLGTMYVVRGSKRGLVIDTGTGIGDFKGLVESLISTPYDVVLTHGHGDHVGGTHQFERFYIHKSDVGMAKGSNINSRRGYVKAILDTYPEGNKLFSAEAMTVDIEAPEIIPFTEGKIFDLGDKKIEVYGCPGHTPGSVCLLDRADKIIFSGDNYQHLCLLFMAGKDRMAVVSKWLDGIKKGAELVASGEVNTLCGGHEELTTDILADLKACGEGVLDGSIVDKVRRKHIFVAPFASYGSVSITYRRDAKRMGKIHYELMRPDEIIEARDIIPVAYLPVGPLEWHGPAMPFGTDPLTAKAVAEGAAECTGGVVLPTLFFGTECPRDEKTLKNIGFNGDEYVVGQDFPKNTLPSLYAREEIFAITVREYIRLLAKQGFKLIVIVNGHGATGQINSLNRLAAECLDEFGVHVFIPHYFAPLDRADIVNMGHATVLETAVMMYLTESVDFSKLPPKEIPLKNTDWGITDGATYAGHANAEGTVVSDPRSSTAERGKLYVENAIKLTVKQVSDYYSQIAE